MRTLNENQKAMKTKVNTIENKISETMFIAGEWYYWDEDLEQWKPETYKFEISCVN